MGVDMSQFIAAKSDQLNADDLIGGPITVKVTAVRGMNDKEQPIAISYDGDNGKPYKPGKSMRRVLVHFWGKNGDDYVGRWFTLYRDPEVTFGKIKVGGIRIGAMSHIDGGEVALAVTKGAKKMFAVRMLEAPDNRDDQGPPPARVKQVEDYIAALASLTTREELADYQLDERRTQWREGVKKTYPALFDRIVAAQTARFEELATADDPGGDATGDPVDRDPADDVDDDGFPS